MKITVRINEFKRVLEEARCAVTGKPTIGALNHVKVDVFSGNQATMSGADLGYFIVQRFELVDGDAGSFLLPAKKTHDFLRGRTSGTATIETSTDCKSIRFTVGSLNMKFESPAVAQFPSLETCGQFSHTISLKFLRNLIARVERACPENYLGGRVPFVKLDSDGTRLRAVATDGYRVAVADAGGDWGTFTVLLPKNFLPLLKRRGGAMIQFAESGDSYFFQTDSVFLRCRKSQVKFPNYQKCIYGPEFGDTVRITSTELKAAIMSLLVTTPTKEPKIVFDLCGEDLKLSTEDFDYTGTCRLKVKTASKSPMKVSLRAGHISDFLAAVEGDVIVQFIDDIRPLRLSDGGAYQYFVMPIRCAPPAAKSSP